MKLNIFLNVDIKIESYQNDAYQNDNYQHNNTYQKRVKYDLKIKKFDGWLWRYQPKECQKTKSIRTGTIFLETRSNFGKFYY